MTKKLSFKVLRQFQNLYKRFRYKILIGGRGSGKSMHIAYAIVYNTDRCKCNVLCLREFQNSISDSSYSLIVQIIDKLGIRDHYHITETEIVHKTTGSWIKFKGLARNIESIKSFDDVDIAWIEEGETLSAKSWAILKPTIRKNRSEIWVSLNARLPTDTIANEFLERDPPEDAWVSHTTYLDNPWISDTLRKEAETCKKINLSEYDHVWLGNYRKDGDMQVIPLGDVQEATKRLIIKPEGLRIAGLDVAYTGGDKSAFVARQGFDAFACETITGLDPIQVGVWGADLCVTHKIDVLVVDANGIGAGTIASLKKWNGNLLQFYGQSASSESKFANKRAECWFKARDWMRQGRIVNSSELITDLIMQDYLINNQDKIILTPKAKMSSSPDCGDALSFTFDPDISVQTKVDTSQFLCDFT